jgi:hypothetical protein
VRVVSPVDFTGEETAGRALRWLKRVTKKPLTLEGRTSSGVPEIKVGCGNVAL